MDNELEKERKYVEVYEHISHDIVQKKDSASIIRELMADGYNEKDAAEWVTAVTSQLRSRMIQRSLLVLIPGILLLVLGLVLRVTTFDAAMAYDWMPFVTVMIVVGAILSVWGMASWAKYRGL